MTVPTDLDALAALAREATAGEWFTDRPEVDRFDHVTGHYTTPDRMHVISRVKPDGQEYAVVAITDGADDEANAAYIAAANPAAVLALIARVRELEGDAVRFAWIANHGVPIMPGAPGIYPTCGKGPAVLRRAVDAAMKPGC